MPTNEELAGWLDEREPRFVAIADAIWKKPEVALTESAACDLQARECSREGFTVTRDVGAMPTAFVAEWGQGRPIIGFLGEYDALPGLSQKPQAEQDPLVADAPGHGCGHNLLGTAAMAATMALKAWLERTGREGTVRYYGCPAEETLAGKVYMARAGVFDDLDAAITWHPSGHNTVSRGSFLAMDNLKFRFRGKTAHAAAQPDAGRSALDAVELMNIGVNFMREHIPEKSRIHYVITNGGGAPNVVPDEAEVWYFVRAPERTDVEPLTTWVRNIAQGAAMMTGTTVTEDYQTGCYSVLSSQALADAAEQALKAVGEMSFTPEEAAFAETIVQGYPAGTREAGIRRMGQAPDFYQLPLDGRIHPSLDRGKIGSGSTDVGDVSWIAPTVELRTTCWPVGIPGHSWGITAASSGSIGHKGMQQAAKAMANLAVSLFTDPSHLARAREEFDQATAGRRYRTPIPEGVQPPIPKG